jgi:hypothetical protein
MNFVDQGPGFENAVIDIEMLGKFITKLLVRIEMNKVISEIREFEKKEDLDGLGSYLIKLAKYGDNPIQYENEFKKHFNSSDWYLRKAAVFCLLFALQIDKPEYRSRAIMFVKDPNEDEEVRRWAAAGLSVTYQKTKDKELMKLFIDVIQNPEEDNSIKESLLSSALLVFGLTSRDQLFRNDEVLPKLGNMLKTFQQELIEINEIIK